MRISALASLLLLPTTLTTPIHTKQYASCREAGTFEPVCAEIYTTSNCTGDKQVITDEGCHDLVSAGVGSIHVFQGSVYAGFRDEDCSGEPDILAGPMWRTGDQGCEEYETLNGKEVRSWNALRDLHGLG